MPEHRHRVGSHVTMSVPDGKSPPKLATYTVEALLPPVGTSLQYRIRSDIESFSRVVVEQQLSETGPEPTMAAQASTGPHRGEEN